MENTRFSGRSDYRNQSASGFLHRASVTHHNTPKKTGINRPESIPCPSVCTDPDNPDAGFRATVTGDMDATNLQLDKTNISSGNTIGLQVDITNTSAAVSTESVTLVVDMRRQDCRED